ncbi:MAG: AAA family ATPase [Burkholderiales bacterium]
MIRAEKIVIKDFRGIRDLTIDFKTKNFAICGPNGTGKSGIVDALEFALTGGISRLSGEGTQGISIKAHAPHVDSRNKPDNARVVFTASLPTLGKSVTIERSVNQPNAPTISDTSPAVLSILATVAVHPEFVLSRRELIQYVVSTPGDRAKEVQSLLRLDAVENLRQMLQKIANSAKKEVGPLSSEKGIAQNNLLSALEITQLTKEKVLEAANKRRKVLGLDPIAALESGTSLKDGLAAKAADKTTVPKVQALSDLGQLKEAIESLRKNVESEKTKSALERLEALKSNAHMETLAKQERLLKSATELVLNDTCPVCDTEWAPTTLKAHIAEKLKALEATTNEVAEVEAQLQPLLESVASYRDALSTVKKYGQKLKPAVDTSAMEAYATALGDHAKVVRDFTQVPATLNSIATISSPMPAGVEGCKSQIAAAIAAIPDPTDQDAARDSLTVAQERLETYRSVSLRLKQAEERGAIAKKAYDAYLKASTEVLNGIYKGVADEFADLYSYINSDDEKSFTAKLTPSMGKLGFDVDFYGRGDFPPGAYHSEGHQDGMGLCLYLALMNRLLGKGFTFAVLDDVLMSVDSGHRREVCNLLKEKFPDTQFVLTTHDPIWLKHMQTAGLVAGSNQLHFRTWNVDEGPTDWNDRDVWAEIDAALEKGDVHDAAATLRHYLEYIFGEICNNLRAPVPFRSDARYQLGDFASPAIGHLKKLFKNGMDSATSWGNTTVADDIDAAEKRFTAKVTASNVEQWQINASVHYNEWANLSPQDFKPVSDAFHELIRAFHCDCGPLYVSSELPPQSLRCSCSKININLKKK